MLHGCRTDLILKCLVYSNKDRNFSLYLTSFFSKVYYINISFYKKNETKMTSKSL